jgi:hypothetical protein
MSFAEWRCYPLATKNWQAACQCLGLSSAGSITVLRSVGQRAGCLYRDSQDSCWIVWLRIVPAVSSRQERGQRMDGVHLERCTKSAARTWMFAGHGAPSRGTSPARCAKHSKLLACAFGFASWAHDLRERSVHMPICLAQHAEAEA